MLWFNKKDILMSRKFRWFYIALAVTLFLAASYIIYMEEQGNFHPITAGEAYRSAQLDRDELEYYITQYNIKSILNLRGKNAGAGWYAEEAEVCRRYHVAHYDLHLSAGREPTGDEVDHLVNIFRNAPLPILIHCRAGADRSGLASAMWKLIIDKEPKSKATKQLSILFGHIPLGSTSVLDVFLERWHPSKKNGPK